MVADANFRNLNFTEGSPTTSEEGSNFFPTSEEGSDQENQTNVKDCKMSLPTSTEGSQENQTNEQHKDRKRGSLAARIVRMVKILFSKGCHGTDNVAVIKERTKPANYTRTATEEVVQPELSVRRVKIFFCKCCHGADSVAVIKRS